MRYDVGLGGKKIFRGEDETKTPRLKRGGESKFNNGRGKQGGKNSP